MKKGYKLCPFCANEIKEGAIKCQFCGEFLEEGIVNRGTQKKKIKVKKGKSWSSRLKYFRMTICILALLIILGYCGYRAYAKKVVEDYAFSLADFVKSSKYDKFACDGKDLTRCMKRDISEYISIFYATYNSNYNSIVDTAKQYNLKITNNAKVYSTYRAMGRLATLCSVSEFKAGYTDNSQRNDFCHNVEEKFATLHDLIEKYSYDLYSDLLPILYKIEEEIEEEIVPEPEEEIVVEPEEEIVVDAAY